MRYSFDHYDQYGFLKPPTLLWLGWLFLARSWVIFAMAGVSRESGSKILALVYPNTDALYFGLVMGLPSMALMWLMSLRSPERVWVNHLTRYGRPVTLLLALGQFAQTLNLVIVDRGAFHWIVALTLVVLFWLILYLFNGRWAKECFFVPSFNQDALNK